MGAHVVHIDAVVWPPGTLTADRLHDGVYFLIGGFDAAALEWAHRNLTGFDARLDGTGTMMLVARRCCPRRRPRPRLPRHHTNKATNTSLCTAIAFSAAETSCVPASAPDSVMIGLRGGPDAAPSMGPTAKRRPPSPGVGLVDPGRQ